MDSFASAAILARLTALTQEIKGVRRNKNIEYLHRMRVAARRLRTALNLFPGLTAPKWSKQIKVLARTLGSARDTDVQIEFIKRALAKAEPRLRPGLRRLLLRLKQRRADLQAEVIKALDKFEKKNAPGRILKSLSATPEDSVAPNLLSTTRLAVSTLVQAVLAFDQPARDPAHSEALHALRVACKHLRYTLEICAPLFEGSPKSPDFGPTSGDVGLQSYIKLAKTYQEILGDIHDCDVWIAALPQFLSDETQRAIDYFGHARSLKTLEPGLDFLRDERAYHRAVRYSEFLDLWQTHLDANTWQNLLAVTQSVPAIPKVPLSPSSPQSSSSPFTPSEAICIGLIGDIHANLPALEAVLAHAREHGAREFWNVGDLVGYGPYPDEVVQLLKREGVLSLAGNYDLKTLQVKQKKEKWKRTKRPEKLLAFEWAYNHLSQDSLDYLKTLPLEYRLALHGRRILLTHGSPASNEEALTPDTPDQHLRGLAQKAGADLIIFGHSHQPFTRQVDGVWFVNTGSVGRPDDGDPRAAYALLHLAPDSLDVSHHRVEYDIERTAAAVREHGLPDSFARIFLYGRSLDDLVVEE